MYHCCELQQLDCFIFPSCDPVLAVELLPCLRLLHCAEVVGASALLLRHPVFAESQYA
jgi:hypothetical protein